MNRISGEDIRKILEKAEKKLGQRINLDEPEHFVGDTFSMEYEVFRQNNLEKSVSKYEKFCGIAEKIIKVKVKDKESEKLDNAIDTAHLDITPGGANSFAAVFTFLVVLFGLTLGVLMYYFTGGVIGFTGTEGGLKSVGFGVFFWPLILVIGGALLLKPISRYPLRIANRWRLRASNQMVLCVLYMVMYMRHTSNLEHAIKFAGEHIGSPLALDLRKVLWDVEVGRFVTIKDSLDNYLEKWRDHNLEFIEAMHLIEGSLYESNEDRRVSLLDKALEVILNGTYEKMLHYAHDLRSPITMVYMLGVVLPVLGLVVFPLMSGFLEGIVKWWHLAILYNIFLPVFVYLYGSFLLEKRPTGYGGQDILSEHPDFEEYTKLDFLGVKVNPGILAILITFLFLVIGFLPLILFYSTSSGYDVTLFEGTFLQSKLLDYKCNGSCAGPYGLISLVLSLFIPLGLAIGLGFYYLIWSSKLVKIRKKVQDLEKEFSGAIFQLGNRVGEGMPVESAFSKVASSMKGSPSGDLLRVIDTNIRKLGMSVKQAIFDKERGGLTLFPSSIIRGSMKVLVESAKKGPQVVAKSLITISDYANKVKAIGERLTDLLADILSSMKSQITFLTPMIAGIVVGVTSMMIGIINNLSNLVGNLDSGNGDLGGLGGLQGALSILNITDIIPGYQFQIVVGLFVVEVVIILTILSNGIENGIDKVGLRNKMAKNLFTAVGLYFVVALVSVLVFSVLANGVADVASASGLGG